MPTSPQHSNNNGNRQNRDSKSTSSNTNLRTIPKKNKFGEFKGSATASNTKLSPKSKKNDKAHKLSYFKLKSATDSFLRALYSKAKYNNFENKKSGIPRILAARGILEEKKLCVGSSALRSLKNAIKFRSYHTNQFYKENGDAGHENFLTLLQESLKVLEPLCKSGFRFETDYVAHSAEPVYLESLTDFDSEIDELIKGSETTRVKVLFSTINEMFKQHLESMRFLKNSLVTSQDDQKYSMFIILQLLQNSFLIGHSIEEINDLEEEILESFPYLNTIYRQIIALNVTELVDDLVNKCNTSTKKEAICLLGDILEILLCRGSYKNERIKSLIHEFCMTHNSNFNFIFESSSISYHNYLQKLISNGKLFSGFDLLESNEYNIMDTIYVIQDIDNILNQFNRQQKSKIKRSNFKKQLENIKSVKDLKDILSFDILFVLIEMIQNGDLSEYTVGEEKVLHLFVELREYIINPVKSLSFSLIFGLHCLLISLVELKDDQRIQKTSKLLKNSFDNYVQQLEVLEKTNSSVKERVENLLQLKSMFSPVTSPLRNLNDDDCFALWNPVIGSSILMFTMIISNIHCSIKLMNNIGQLNVTLHLYNALLQRNLIKEDEIPFLASIHKLFLKNNSLWCSHRLPKKEELVFRFCTSLGFEERKALKLDQEVFYTVAEGSVNNEIEENDARRFNDNRFFQVQPEDISKSYEKIYLEEFGDELAENSLKSLQERINLTISILEKEIMLLSSNFLVVGAKLEKFFQDLFRHLKWDEDVNEALRRIPSVGIYNRPAKEQSFMQHIFVYKLLGRLDYNCDEGLRISTEIQRTINFMKSYFNNMQPSEYALF